MVDTGAQEEHHDLEAADSADNAVVWEECHGFELVPEVADHRSH